MEYILGLLKTFFAVAGLLFGSGNLDTKKARNCTSTVFGSPNDKWKGGKAFCLGREINTTDFGVAHRTLPCGTMLLIRNPKNGKIATATVVDRGPYGAIYEGEWRLKKSEEDPGRWRGCLDITPALADALEHNGYQKVMYYVLKNTRQ